MRILRSCRRCCYHYHYHYYHCYCYMTSFFSSSFLSSFPSSSFSFPSSFPSWGPSWIFLLLTKLGKEKSRFVNDMLDYWSEGEFQLLYICISHSHSQLLLYFVVFTSEVWQALLVRGHFSLLLNHVCIRQIIFSPTHRFHASSLVIFRNSNRFTHQPFSINKCVAALLSNSHLLFYQCSCFFPRRGTATQCSSSTIRFSSQI